MMEIVKRFLFLSFLFSSHVALAGSFVINQVSGFTDTTAVSPVGGNPGTTVGAQRANIFAQAASVWTAILQPHTNITIDAQFSALFCNTTGAVLGSAGPTNTYRDFPGATYPNTWYPRALRDHLSNSTLGTSAITANFNSQIEGNAGCLGGAHWYYGYDHNPGANQIDLLEIILHEMGHGLGFITLVNLSTGAKNLGYDDIYMKFLRDDNLNKNWPAMSNAERISSAKNNGNLVWNGSKVQHLLTTLTNGLTNTYPRLYAPTTVSSGSSVSHWDTNVTYLGNKNELMEYQYSFPFDMALTVALMRDLGWTNAVYDFDGDGTNDDVDAFPQTNAADSDTDGDGMPDNWLPGSGCSGSTCAGLTLDGDDDGDGVPDVVDASPLDSGITTEVNLPLNNIYKGLRYSLNKQNQ